MISSENKRKELEHILNRENFVRIASAIKMLRDESPFVGAISLLVTYYDRSNNNSIKKIIRDFLNDLKDQSCCSEVVDQIRREIQPDTKRMVVSSCWQSGLNYSMYSTDFTDLFLESDYLTAIECFTVIESSVLKMTRKEKDVAIKMIRKGSSPEITDKTALALELISVLE